MFFGGLDLYWFLKWLKWKRERNFWLFCADFILRNWPDREERCLTRDSQSPTWQRGCPTACWAHARQLGHVVDAVMAIINLTMRSPKAAAAGSSDRQRPYVATVSGHQSGPPFPFPSFLLFAGVKLRSVCVFWPSVLNGVTSHVCFCGCVTLCCHLCDLNTGCAKTQVYVAFGYISRRSRHRYPRRFHKGEEQVRRGEERWERSVGGWHLASNCWYLGLFLSCLLIFQRNLRCWHAEAPFYRHNSNFFWNSQFLLFVFLAHSEGQWSDQFWSPSHQKLNK